MGKKEKQVKQKEKNKGGKKRGPKTGCAPGPLGLAIP